LYHEFDYVKRVLSILETVEFRWTIAEVLEQDEKWAHDIFELKSVGGIIYENSRAEALDNG